MANTKRRCKYHKEYFPMEDMLKTNAGWFKDYDAMAKFGLDKARKDKEKKAKKAHTEKKRKLKDEGILIMKIEIDDEMLATAEKYDRILSSPDVSEDGQKEWEQTKRELLSMLMAKIETEKMFQRITA